MTFAASLKSIRLMHRYLGLFFAPTNLTFAGRGGQQMRAAPARSWQFLPISEHPRASLLSDGIVIMGGAHWAEEFASMNTWGHEA